MKKNRQVFMIKSFLFSVCFLLVLFLGAVSGFAGDPNAGFDFSDDESVINEQIEAAKKEDEQKRIVSSTSLANDMKEQVNLLQQAVLCYKENDPIDYKDKCTPAVRQLQSFRFNLQTLRGGQIQYKSNSEKSAMMGAAAVFDELFPNAIQLITWCADTFMVKDFAKKKMELETQKRWYDDKKSEYLSALKLIDSRIAQELDILKAHTKEADQTTDNYHYSFVDRSGLLREAALNDYILFSGTSWFPKSKGAFLYDMDRHWLQLKEDKIAQYGEAYDYFAKEITKFDPFFAKWNAQIEKIAVPYNSYLAKLLEIVKDSQEEFSGHGLAYGEILNELESSDGLGAFASGELTKGNKCLFAEKNVSYSWGMEKAMKVLWSQAEMYNAIVSENIRSEQRK